MQSPQSEGTKVGAAEDGMERRLQGSLRFFWYGPPKDGQMGRISEEEVDVVLGESGDHFPLLMRFSSGQAPEYHTPQAVEARLQTGVVAEDENDWDPCYCWVHEGGQD